MTSAFYRGMRRCIRRWPLPQALTTASHLHSPLICLALHLRAVVQPQLPLRLAHAHPLRHITTPMRAQALGFGDL
jgi:hypothetical protein